jgi:uncharacterized integral membrane protein
MSTALLHYQQTLVYEGNTTLARLREDLGSLQNLDLRAERLRRQWFWTNLAVGAVLLVAVFIAISNDEVPRSLLGGLLGIPATLLVIGLIRHATVKRLDVENRRYQLAEELMRLLSRDMEKDAAFFIRMDLLPPTHEAKERKRAEVNGWNVTSYTDPWLTLRGRLLDGSRFSLTVRDHLELRKRWKRTSRGKHKLKTKKFEGLSAYLKVRPDPERLEPLRALGDALPKPRLPRGTEVEGLRVEEDAVVLELYLPGHWVPGRENLEADVSALDLLAAAFLGVYRLFDAPRASDERRL